MRYVLDTNIFIDFLIDRDETRHEACVKLMRRISKKETKIVFLSVVIAELAWVLGTGYKVDKGQVVRFLGVLTKKKGAKVTEKYLWERVCGEYERKKVKFVDAMIAGVKQVAEKKWAVITYDKDFDKLGVLNIKPEEL